MSLLSKAAKQSAEARRERNTVVCVTGYESVDSTNQVEQVMVCNDVITGEELRIALGAVTSEVASSHRTTIADLANHDSRSVEPGGFVRVDGVKPWANGVSLAKFVKPLKRGPKDGARHFAIVKACVTPPRARELRGSDDQRITSTIHAIRDQEVVNVANGSALKGTVVQILTDALAKGSAAFTPSVYLRGGNEDRLYRFSCSRIKLDNGEYRNPTPDEIRAQVNESQQLSFVASALDEAGGQESIGVVPGDMQVVTGLLAQEPHYEIHAKTFYQGTFKAVNEDGETGLTECAGYRTTIIGYEKKETASGPRWFVSSVAATLSDQLTLNGMASAAALRNQAGPAKGATQTQSTAPAPEQDQAPAQNAPQSSAQPAPVAAAAVAAAAQPAAAPAPEDEMSLDDLLADAEDEHDLIERTAAAFDMSNF